MLPDNKVETIDCKRSEATTAYEDYGVMFGFAGAVGQWQQCHTLEEYNNSQDGDQDDDDYSVASYNNSLLTLAIDLGERLLPAFRTKTGIPYGTVNLRYGVPVGETNIASTAGAGSLMMEFEVLSRLTGDRRFGDAANKATKVCSFKSFILDAYLLCYLCVRVCMCVCYICVIGAI